ncbi:unnamed protein product [Aspergillus oryzae]|uniref:Unnamed protein product n=1 Tax=Aspergillus oryzae var. brunneus TaxID=332754 RepID=A0ABQ6KWI2_ASPOZ|nr:unnamed protein product [Aspergillus oryzae]GMF87651.1 unnamed protein product [Aspergillus oryzae]GMG46484.1 unnamed protein product [Aspergillus oryzae var. brunneus]
MYRSLMLIALYISALAAAAPNPPSNEPDNQPPNQPVVGIRPPNQPVVGLPDNHPLDQPGAGSRPPNQPVVGLPDNHPLNQPGAGSRPPNQPVVGLPDNHPLNQPGAGSRPPNQPANPLADQQDLSPARLATRNLHNNCQNIRIENPPPPLQNMDTANAQPRYATELTASPESEYWSDASTLRGSERRANLPRAPKPLLVGNCKKRDGQSRETKLSLDYCLGWREENGGTLVAESR